MNCNYDDIRSRIADAPQWFDEHAVPRYCKFEPTEVANIYAEEVALVLVECQSCGREFRVAVSTDKGTRARYAGQPRDIARALMLGERPWLTIDRIAGHFGDPPNVECCPAGPTMNAVPRLVLEWWALQDEPGLGCVWVRSAEHDGVDITPDWAKEHTP